MMMMSAENHESVPYTILNTIIFQATDDGRQLQADQDKN